MSILHVAERELRSAARRPRTHAARFLAGSAGVIIFAWCVFLLQFGSGFTGRDLFDVLRWMAFVYCLVAGAIVTADCLSEERREGTLGLLFLTNLRGADVVLGKLTGAALNAVFGLLAIFPVLGIPLLMGGVSPDQFLRASLSLLNTLFVSLSIGIWVSSLSREPLRAASVALAIAACLGFGLPGISALLEEYRFSKSWVFGVILPSPFHSQIAAMQTLSWAAPSYYWTSLALSHLAGLLFLGAACWIVPRTWRDKTSSSQSSSWKERFRQWRFRAGDAPKVRLRRARFLDRNAFYWIAARDRLAPLGLLLLLCAVALGGIWLCWTVGAVFGGGQGQSLFEGFIFTWMWVTFALHGLVLFNAAVAACARFGEDRRSGAMELLLATPLSSQRIVAGHWLGWIRRLAAPMIIAMLAHAALFFGLISMFRFSDPQPIQWGKVGSEILGFLLQGSSLHSDVASVAVVLGGLALFLAATWITLAWTGSWLSLRLKHPRFAPWLTLLLVLLPPWPVFTLCAYVYVTLGFLWHEDELIRLNAQTLFFLCGGHYLLLIVWSWARLRWNFRGAAAGEVGKQHAQPVRVWATRAAAGLLLAALVISGYYSFTRWRGERAWKRSRTEAASQGASLSLSSLAAPPVPDEKNFAITALWGPLFSFTGAALPSEANQSNQITAQDLYQLSTLPRNPRNPAPQPPQAADWVNGLPTDLPKWQEVYRASGELPPETAANPPAEDVLLFLQRFDPILQRLRTAAQRPFARFPAPTPVSAAPLLPHLDVLRNFSNLLNLRACALLALNRPEEAFEDLTLLFYLASSLDLEPFPRSRATQQGLFATALQPFWEGLWQQRWSAEQLAQIETKLAPINLLESYPKAGLFTCLEQIHLWEAVADPNSEHAEFLPSSDHARFLLRLLYPRGRARQKQAALYQEWKDHFSRLIDPKTRRCYLTDQLPEQRKRSRNHLYLYAGRYDDPFDSLTHNLALAQSSIDLARVAGALERFRLKNGQFPNNLNELAPGFLARLPRDLMTGEPLRYRLTPKPGFVLHQTGWNGKNDGGNPHRDWVWMSEPPKPIPSFP